MLLSEAWFSRALEVLQVTVKRKMRFRNTWDCGCKMYLSLTETLCVAREKNPHSWNYLLMSEWDGIWNSAGVLPHVSVLLPKNTKFPLNFWKYIFLLISAVACPFCINLYPHASVVWILFGLLCFHMFNPLPTEACRKEYLWLSVIVGLDLFLKYSLLQFTVCNSAKLVTSVLVCVARNGAEMHPPCMQPFKLCMSWMWKTGDFF